MKTTKSAKTGKNEVAKVETKKGSPKAVPQTGKEAMAELKKDLIKAAAAPKAPVTPPADKKKAAEKKEKAPGVIATIVSLVEKADKKKGVSKEYILEHLVALFPKKAKDSMKNTINIQLPSRISKERWAVKKLENGNYCKE